MDLSGPWVNPESAPRRKKGESKNRAKDEWRGVVSSTRGGYVVRIRRRLGALTFLWHESKPLPSHKQAEAHAAFLLAVFEHKRPLLPYPWFTWRVVPRRLRGGKEVWVGTVRKWLGASSYVWREISPNDSRQEAERMARQSVEAGLALEEVRS